MRGVIAPKDLFRQLERDGWRIEPTALNHRKCYSPCGRFLVTCSGRFGNGDDWHNVRNFLRDLKRIAGWTPRE